MQGYGKADRIHRSQPDKSPRWAGDRASRVGGSGCPDGLFHGARPSTLCAGSQETCNGSSGLSDRPATIINCWNAKEINKGRFSNSLINILCPGVWTRSIYLTAWLGPPIWLVPGSFRDVPGPRTWDSKFNLYITY